MNIVGQRIREERRKLNLTLEQLAQQTELSKSFLSQIERGHAQPSIASLKRIAQRFGMSMMDLFTNHGPEGPAAEQPVEKNNYIKQVDLVPADKRKKFTLPDSHIVYEMVTPDLKRKMQILYLRFEPGESIGSGPISDPGGEKCFLVLKGSIEYRLGEETYTLHAGDSIYFPADLPQYWRGTGDEPIEAIVVMTPPWF